MPSTLGARADGVGEHTPTWRVTLSGSGVARAGVTGPLGHVAVRVLVLVGVLALLEQLARVQVTGGLGRLEALGQRVVVTGLQVLGELVVADAGVARGLFAGVRHASESTHLRRLRRGGGVSGCGAGA